MECSGVTLAKSHLDGLGAFAKIKKFTTGL
jgi:hypothetical protein